MSLGLYQYCAVSVNFMYVGEYTTIRNIDAGDRPYMYGRSMYKSLIAEEQTICEFRKDVQVWILLYLCNHGNTGIEST